MEGSDTHTRGSRHAIQRTAQGVAEDDLAGRCDDILAELEHISRLSDRELSLAAVERPAQLLLVAELL